VTDRLISDEKGCTSPARERFALAAGEIVNRPLDGRCFPQDSLLQPRPILRNSRDFNRRVVFLQHTSTIFRPTRSTGFLVVPYPAVLIRSLCSESSGRLLGRVEDSLGVQSGGCAALPLFNRGWIPHNRAELRREDY
jgi:hypothetical protein